MMQIRLTKGLYALVDADVYEHLSQWKWLASEESRGTKFYAIRWEKICGRRVKIRMHHAVVRFYGGEIPHNMVVDHCNHNSLDNRVSNLEVITQSENMKRSPGWKKKKVGT